MKATRGLSCINSSNRQVNFKNNINKLGDILGLSFALARAEFKLRNEGSYLGVFWYLLNPLLVIGLLFFVFSDRLGNDIPYYLMYLFLGVTMFNFFQSVTLESAKAIIEDHRGLVKSINFPRESLIISVILKNFFAHIFEIVLFALLLLFLKSSVLSIVYYLAVLPFFLLFVFGVSLLLSVITVYFVDVKNIWAFASRLLWLGTPIFYAIGGQTKLFYLNLFNPMYYFITFSREAVIYSRFPDTMVWAGMIFYAVVFFSVGLLIFSMLKVKIAEKI
ncbi:MAG: hypothetical protein EXS52_02065 [Candidatus Staskawiczbacteria bacterium]|nr:hypothetical protein [Candidatus Staskawiczbacteria bacterium]